MTYYQVISAIFELLGDNISNEDFIEGLKSSVNVPIHCSLDLNVMKTHKWNIDKKLFLSGKTDSLYCKECNINFINMINYDNKTKLTCEEQIIKVIIE
jgi:hypothetical protein